jgi:hypothetical protein
MAAGLSAMLGIFSSNCFQPLPPHLLLLLLTAPAYSSVLCLLLATKGRAGQFTLQRALLPKQQASRGPLLQQPLAVTTGLVMVATYSVKLWGLFAAARRAQLLALQHT